MGRIFSLLALLQIAAGYVRRMLGRFVDSLADPQPGYYGLAGEWVYVDPTDDPTHVTSDPQAEYSAANLAAQCQAHPDVWEAYSEALRAAEDNAK